MSDSGGLIGPDTAPTNPRKSGRNTQWLATHLIRDIEELRAQCGLSNDVELLESVLASGTATSTMGSAADIIECRDLVIVDYPETLAARDRLDAIKRRPFPMASCSLFIVCDDDDKAEASAEAAAFRERVASKVISFRSVIGDTPPPNPVPIAPCTDAEYFAAIARARLQEARSAAVEQLRSMPDVSAATMHAVRAGVEEERRWLKRRLSQLSADLLTCYSAPDAQFHMKALLDAVSSDIWCRYGVAKMQLDLSPFVVPADHQPPATRVFIHLVRDIALTIKTGGFWLLTKLNNAGPPSRDKRDIALERLLARDINAMGLSLYSAIEPKLEGIVMARISELDPAYAELARWRSFAGRAFALHRRLSSATHR